MSIIIPVYNSEKYLKKSIESVIQQTYPNKEIIIVDDESNDSSYSIAKSFESEGIKVIRQQNAGAAVARNTGLEVATGEYIQFLDADDYLSLDKIEKQVLALNGQVNKLAVCNYVSFIDDAELNERLITKDQSKFIYSTNNPPDFLINLWGGNQGPNFIQTNSWLVPRKIITRAGGWRNYRCPDDDGEFFARVILASDGIVFVPGIYNYYRRSKTVHKLSANSNKKYVQNTLLTIDLKNSYLKAFRNTEPVNRAFAVQYLHFSVYNYPRHKILSQIAYRRYKKLKEKVPLPLLGGKIIEVIKKTLGWKTAALIKYYLR